MKTGQQNSRKFTPPKPVDKSLSYAEFTLLLGHYKRAVFELIYQADDPIKKLLQL